MAKNPVNSIVVKNIIDTGTTAQKMRFSIKDIFSKCDQIHSFLWIWSLLLKTSLMGNFIFGVVNKTYRVREILLKFGFRVQDKVPF